MRNEVGLASVASKFKHSALENEKQGCPRVLGEEERGVHILLRWPFVFCAIVVICQSFKGWNFLAMKTNMTSL